MRRQIEHLERFLEAESDDEAKRRRKFREKEYRKNRAYADRGRTYEPPTPQKTKKKVLEWDEDLCFYLVASLIAEHGEDILDEGKILTVQSVRAAGGKVGQFFVPPMKTIVKIGKEDIPDSEKLWWEAVTELLEQGKAYDMADPENLKPLYGKVTSLWKNKIKAKYGYRPSRSDERSLQGDIDRSISDAAKAMRAARAKGGVSPADLSKAARAMGARRHAKRASK